MPSPLNRVRAQHGLQPLPGPPRPVSSVGEYPSGSTRQAQTLMTDPARLEEGNTILLVLHQRQEYMVRRFHAREEEERLSPPTTPPSSP